MAILTFLDRKLSRRPGRVVARVVDADVHGCLVKGQLVDGEGKGPRPL